MSLHHTSHFAVMSTEVADSLAIMAQGVYIDATYGRGGHSRKILQKLDSQGKLYAFDRDSEAVVAARSNHTDDERFEVVHARFSQVRRELLQREPNIQVSGIVADLGVSSPQLDDASRGFSFRNDGPLDMRMDRNEELNAASWLQQASQQDLRDTFKSFGEERYAGRIARTIVERRAIFPLATTRQLADLVAECVPSHEPDKHPATRTFLAIRMRVNRELREITDFLPQCVDLLRQGGRLVVITFHSVEDRIVKRFMRDAQIGAPGPVGVPFRNSEFHPTLKIIGKALRPSASEIHGNRRARSAVMRVAERIGGANA